MNKMLNKINNELLKLQFSPKLSGYKYIRDAVIILVNDNKIFNLKKDVYPILAQKYSVSVQCIDKSINTIIEKSFLNMDSVLLEEDVCHIVNFDKGKPTVKQFIMYLYDKVS